MKTEHLQLDDGQNLAVELALAERDVLITGRSGTGRSTVLKELRRELPGNVVFLAPTARAAREMEGSTINRVFGFPPASPLPPGYVSELSPEQGEIVSSVETLVIEDASMVRSDVFAAIDATLRRYATPSQARCSFGGRQVVMVGDFLQFPAVVRPAPVWTDPEGEPGGCFALGPAAWQLASFRLVELRQAYRHSSDQPYLQALDCIRRGEKGTPDMAFADCLRWLNDNVQILDCPPKGVTTLCTTRARAMDINRCRNRMLSTPVHTAEADVYGTLEAQDHPTDRVLQFRVGSRVMFVTDEYTGEYGEECEEDGKDHYANGDVGHVLAYHPEEELVEVQLDDGRTVSAEPFTWTDDEYMVTRRNGTGSPHLEQATVGYFSQYPVKLADAVAIRDVQGLTLERVHIDLGRGVFVAGQLYAALSRCESLAGLSLSRRLHPRDVLVDPAALAFYDEMFVPLGDVAGAVVPAR
jgi:ATP-dependent DNA helicase PIF1